MGYGAAKCRVSTMLMGSTGANNGFNVTGYGYDGERGLVPCRVGGDVCRRQHDDDNADGNI